MRIRIIESDCTCGKNFDFRLKDPSHGHLFVRFRSNARVLTKNGYENASVGDFILYRAEESMGYGTGDWVFNHDYFRFYLSKGEESFFDVETSVLYRYPLSKRLEDIFGLMLSEFYSVREKREVSLDLCGKLFLTEISEYVSGCRQDRVYQKSYNRLLKLRLEMMSRPEEEWTVEVLAEKMMMSPSYFQYLYKKIFGISCINDCIQRRIEKAKNLLVRSNKKEAEIASLCGYNNVEHFVRQFKKFTGLSPTEFKKQAIFL